MGGPFCGSPRISVQEGGMEAFELVPVGDEGCGTGTDGGPEDGHQEIPPGESCIPPGCHLSARCQVGFAAATPLCSP